MTDFDWNQFGSTSGFWKADNVGDSIAGEVIAVRIGKDFNRNDCPELVVRVDGDEDITVTAGQKVLQNRLAEVRPQIGEKVAIVYSGVGDSKPGQAPAKLFTVQVRGTDGQLRQAPAETGAEPAPAAAPTPPAVSQPAASSLV